MAQAQGQILHPGWQGYFAHMKNHGGSISYAYYLANSLNAYHNLPESVRDEFRGVLNEIIAQLNLDDGAFAGYQAVVNSRAGVPAYQDRLRGEHPPVAVPAVPAVAALEQQNINGQQEDAINENDVVADVLNWLAAAAAAGVAAFDHEQGMADFDEEEIGFAEEIDIEDDNPFGAAEHGAAAGAGHESGAGHGDVDLDLPAVEDQAEDDLEFFDVSEGEEEEEEDAPLPFQNIIGQHEEANNPFIQVEDWLADDDAVDDIPFDSGTGQPAAAGAQPDEIYAVLHLSLNIFLIAFVAYQLYRKHRKNRLRL